MPPNTYQITKTTLEDTATSIDLSTGLTNLPTNISWNILSQPSNGSLTVISGSSYTYTSTYNSNGTDEFSYNYIDTDTSSPSPTYWVGITINPINDAPTTSNVSASTYEDNTVDITLVGSDIENDFLTYSIVSDPSHGSLGLISGNIVTYTPTLK